MTTILASAQKKNDLIIATTIDKGNYFYIPQTALVDSVQAILYQDKSNIKLHSKDRPIIMYWNSNCNDGNYELTITPRQIFFSSFNDNPNPNFLFWAIEIDSSIFKQIHKGLKKNKPKGFINLSKHYNKSLIAYYENTYKDTFSLPDKWTKDQSNNHDFYCKFQVEKQLKNYLGIINSYLDHNNTQAVSFPTNILNKRYFSSNTQDLLNWPPSKFTPPTFTNNDE